MIGKKAPDFCLKNHEEKEYCLKDFKGKWIVLYFYPKDNTSGCTKEAIGFSEKEAEFEKLGAIIIGISKDSPASHKRFIEKHNLKILLLSDPEHKILESYGAWGLKKSYGKETYGTIRSTFIIDPEGIIRAQWKKVKVAGHVEKVLETLRRVQTGENSNITEEMVLEAFKKSGKPLRTGEVAEILKADKKDVEKIIRNLKKAGKIESPKRCYYAPKS